MASLLATRWAPLRVGYPRARYVPTVRRIFSGGVGSTAAGQGRNERTRGRSVVVGTTLLTLLARRSAFTRS